MASNSNNFQHHNIYFKQCIFTYPIFKIGMNIVNNFLNTIIMKKQIILSLLFSMFLAAGFAKDKKITFHVNGKCGMCEERIENALDIKGVKLADWSVETKMCTVKFNPEVISEKEIHQIIAKVGHDTAQCKATDKDYNSLHHCCHYKRE